MNATIDLDSPTALADEAITFWQTTLPADSPLRDAYPCDHCTHCALPLIYNYEGTRTYGHLLAGAVYSRACRVDATGDPHACHCDEWDAVRAAYRAAHADTPTAD